MNDKMSAGTKLNFLRRMGGKQMLTEVKLSNLKSDDYIHPGVKHRQCVKTKLTLYQQKHTDTAKNHYEGNNS